MIQEIQWFYYQLLHCKLFSIYPNYNMLDYMGLQLFRNLQFAIDILTIFDHNFLITICALLRMQAEIAVKTKTMT